MRKQLLFAAILVCVTAYFSACKKDKTDPATPPPPSIMNSAKDFVDKYGMDKQTFTFNTTELPKTFTLNEGTKITIHANSLTRNGVPVTGELTMEAFEIKKRSDAIFTGTNTNHISGRPLVTDGFFYIDVKADGISVDQNLAIPYTVSMPTAREGEFTSIWQGDINTNGSGQLGWEVPPTGAVDSVKALDSLFNFSMRGLGWVNCDVFYNSGAPLTTLNVDVLNNPGSFATLMGSTGETFVLFCPQGENVVAQLYSPFGNTGVKSYDNSMPVGAQGRLLAFAVNDGRFYLASKDITITQNMTVTLTLAETTEAAIASAIEALDTY